MRVSVSLPPKLECPSSAARMGKCTILSVGFISFPSLNRLNVHGVLRICKSIGLFCFLFCFIFFFNVVYVYIISWCPDDDDDDDDDVYRLRMTFLENKSLFFRRRFASRRGSAPLFVAFGLSHPRRRDGKIKGVGGEVGGGGNLSNWGRKGFRRGSPTAEWGCGCVTAVPYVGGGKN